MKKIFLIAALAFSTFAMTSCTKENVKPTGERSDLGTVQAERSDLGTVQ